MNIGVNARRLSGQRLGIGRYIEYMLKHWQDMLEQSERVTLYVREPLNGSLSLSDAFTVETLRPSLNGLLWENVVLSRSAKDVDVLFGPSYTMPVRFQGKSVVAVHSVNEAQAGTHPWWYGLTYANWYRLSARQASRVIVPSYSTSLDVQEHYGIDAGMIDVVPEGVDESFRPLEDAALLRNTRRRYVGSDRPYILFVGTCSQRRNIPTLMEAFGILKKRHGIPHALLVLGPNPLGLPLEALAEEFGITDSFHQTEGKVDHHSELIAIYNGAEIYAYPSTYDGFSLTVVEAMACGVPVVAVDSPALQEIAGGCASLLPALSAEALAAAIYELLSNPVHREDLRRKGLERARKLQWRTTAQATLDVIRSVVTA